MSLDVSGSKYVKVYDTEIELQVSDKIVFARLSSSRKTGNNRVDSDTGEILMDGKGKPLPERRFSSWNAKFVGNAFEPSKGLASGQSINILSGWIVNEPYKKKDGSTGYSVFVTVADFEVCDIVDGIDDTNNDTNERNIT